MLFGEPNAVEEVTRKIFSAHTAMNIALTPVGGLSIHISGKPRHSYPWAAEAPAPVGSRGSPFPVARRRPDTVRRREATNMPEAAATIDPSTFQTYSLKKKLCMILKSNVDRESTNKSKAAAIRDSATFQTHSRSKMHGMQLH